jgi:membrane protein involved in colicin uptake
MQNVNVGPSAGQTNLSNILVLAAPEAMTGQKQVWSMQDPGATYRQNVGLYQQKVEAEQAAAARAAQLAAQQQAAAEAAAAKRQNTDLYGGGDSSSDGGDLEYTSGSDDAGSYGDGGTYDWAGLDQEYGGDYTGGVY